MFSLSALKHSDVRRVVLSQLLSQICDKLMIVAVMWVIADKISTSWLPWYVVAGGLPHLLLAGCSGRVIAKLKILPAVVGTEIFRGVVLLSFPFFVALETPPIEALLVMTFFLNVGSAIFNPAILSLPLLIADDETRPQVNAMIDACFSLANVIGPVLSVVLFAHLGLGGLILLNGVSYLVAAAVQYGVRARPSHSDNLSDAPTHVTPIRAILKREPLLRQMMLSFLGINLFAAPFAMIFPLYVKQVYHLDIKALATLETSFGVGAVIGAVMLATMHFSSKLGPKIAKAVLVVGLSLVAFSLGSTLTIGMSSLLVMGLSLSMANVWILTFFQSVIPQDEVPSLMGVVNLVSVAATPVSLAVTGLIIDRFAITQIALVSALAFVGIASVLLFIPRLREV